MPPKDNEIDYNYLFQKLNIQDDKEKISIRTEIFGFEKFYERVKEQPISSFIRTVELKCRTLHPVFHEFFNIDYGEMSGTNVKIGSCMLLIGTNVQNAERFRILLPKGAKEEDIRNIVAHETGHLYIAVRLLEKDHKNSINSNPQLCLKILQDCLTANIKYEDYENRANVIGISVINKRSCFYKSRLQENAKSLCKNFKPIVDDFEKLKKL